MLSVVLHRSIRPVCTQWGLRSWICEVDIVKLKSWIHEVKIVNSWSWNLEFVTRVEIVNSWSWNCEFKMKSGIHEFEMSPPVFRRASVLLLLHHLMIGLLRNNVTYTKMQKRIWHIQISVMNSAGYNPDLSHIRSVPYTVRQRLITFGSDRVRVNCANKIIPDKIWKRSV